MLTKLGVACAVAMCCLSMLALASCGSREPVASTASAAPEAQLAGRYGLHLDGGVRSFSDTVPADLTSAPWAETQQVCRKAGFDLSPYRGQKVTQKWYRLKERLHGAPATLVVIERADSIVGAYVGVESESGGYYSLPYVKGEV